MRASSSTRSIARRYLPTGSGSLGRARHGRRAPRRVRAAPLEVVKGAATAAREPEGSGLQPRTAEPTTLRLSASPA